MNIQQENPPQGQGRPDRNRMLEFTLLGISLIFAAKLLIIYVCLSLFFMLIGTILVSLVAFSKHRHWEDDDAWCPKNQQIIYDSCIDIDFLLRNYPSGFEFIAANVTLEECAIFVRYFVDYQNVDWYQFAITKGDECYSVSSVIDLSKFRVSDKHCFLECREEKDDFDVPEELEDDELLIQPPPMYEHLQPTIHSETESKKKYGINELFDNDIPEPIAYDPKYDTKTNVEQLPPHLKRIPPASIGGEDDDDEFIFKKKLMGGCGDKKGKFFSIFSRYANPCEKY